MATSLPSVVIAHGAWHQSKHYDTFANALTTAGFPSVTTPQLSSSSTAPPEDAFAQDAAVVRKAIAKEFSSGHDVLLFAHSYGGCVATEALNDLPASTNKIVGVIFLAAIVPEAGESLATAMKTGLAGYVQLDPPLCTVKDAASAFYNTCTDKSVVDAAVAALLPHSLSCFMVEVKEAGWKDYPCGYVKCMLDFGLTLVDQEWAVEKLMKRKGEGMVQVVELQSDHCPVLGMPEGLAGVVRGMVEGFAGR